MEVLIFDKIRDEVTNTWVDQIMCTVILLRKPSSFHFLSSQHLLQHLFHHQNLSGFKVKIIVITIIIHWILADTLAKCTSATCSTFMEVSWNNPILMEAAVTRCRLWRVTLLDTHLWVALVSAVASLVDAGIVREVEQALHVAVRHASRVDHLLQVHHLVPGLHPLVSLAKGLLKSGEISRARR